MSNATYHRFTDRQATISGLKANTKYYAKVRTIETEGPTCRRTPPRSARRRHRVPLSRPRATPPRRRHRRPAARLPTRPPRTCPRSKAYTFKGHGYGHGIGMGQYGAEGGAAPARATPRSSAPTTPARPSSKGGNIRVLITGDTTDSVMVEGRSGLRLRNVSANKTLALPTTVGGNKVVRWSIEPLASDPRSRRCGTGPPGRGRPTRARRGPARRSSRRRHVARHARRRRPYVSQAPCGRRSRDPDRRAATRSTSCRSRTTRGVSWRARCPRRGIAEALKAQAVAARTYGVRRHVDPLLRHL